VTKCAKWAVPSTKEGSVNSGTSFFILQGNNENMAKSFKNACICAKKAVPLQPILWCAGTKSGAALNREGCVIQPLSRSRESYATAFLHSKTTVTTVMGRFETRETSRKTCHEDL
jgi:hypothetical protein